ncbi:MAG: hypothetical protein CVV44_13910 [Spirochaetae bacterium HGW-Spirochaetae-1]|jgi:serine phosphatase RsbU (regulator of sigma subunit)|nr:MAG: hypothetical protein CVV44_13910 [Spirochaetae bacterium HGW-Spirochaetae-1]
MDLIFGRFNLYVIPPLLSLLLGWVLALVAVIKGKMRRENILFALMCLWWTFMPLVFISHQVFRGETDKIMMVERSVHFIYVYIPFIMLLYLQMVFNLNKRFLVIASFIISAAVSGFVPTEYYFNGLYTYSWGYSARGGIAFKIFGVYAMLVTIFGVFFFIYKIRAAAGSTEKLKLKYINFSFLATAILTILNIPAISGIDFYAFGNFMFIPLSLLAYGVLRYRFMDIRSVMHITLIWGVTSSLILIPNIIAYYLLKPYLGHFGYAAGFFLLLVWFILNYLYLKIIQPAIDRIFNKQKFNLQRLEVQFVENISVLKTLEELTRVFTGTLQKNLYFREVDIFIRLNEKEGYWNQGGKEIAVDDDIREWFIGANHLADRDMVLADPYYLYIREKMLAVLDDNNSRYILPLVQNNELIGVALLGERLTLKELNYEETRFINSVRSALSISISNSLMYQDLSDLKDNLEDKVTKRTEELLSAMEKVEAFNEELTRTNDELNSARKIAEMDMMMAVNVQKSLLPAEPPETPGWDIALVFKPMAGISGDFYDFYVEDGDLKGLVLLDVSGHGIASGLITMIARSVFQRNFFRYNDVKLGSVVEEANRDLINEIENVDNYLTGIVLRFTDETVEYVNAGHPDLVLRQSKNGVVSMVNSRDRNFRGAFLGVRAMDFPYRTLKFNVEPGDVLLVYTDGIAEGTNAEKTEYGSEGLARALHKAPGESSRSILDYIMHDFHAFTGNGKLSDDLTLIVIKKK